MSIIKNSEIKVLASPGNIYNAKIETDEVEMDNFQAAHFNIVSGVGAATKVKAEVVATDADGENEHVLIEREIIVGEKRRERIIVDADRLAKKNNDRVFLRIANAGKADITGTIFVVLTNERYSGDQSR